MRLKDIALHNFRNYIDQTLQFSDGINVFLGENAQGKTNLLEAIYVLALTRSHRTSNEKELINWQSQTAQLKGTIQKQLGKVPIELDLGTKGKRAKINHLEQAKLSSYVGQLNVILFAPEDLSIVKGAPQVRRKFMDMEFGQMSNRYLYNSTQYKKILRQRNRYLRDLQHKIQSDRVYLDVLSDQLSAYGAEIIYQRIQLLKKLEGFAKNVHTEISQGKEALTFLYQTAVPDEQLTSIENIYQNLLKQFADIKEKEIQRGTTLLGPHRDDLKFAINKKEVQSFGSQGQQRTTALSVKLAEIDLMKEQTNEYPILLLDDVLSELDDYRQTHLLTAIQDKVQTFLTTTSLSGVQQELLSNPKIFRIANGKVNLEES
ncbi:DNA replication/repair protein RecF [Lentilactobacillus hilgardii]|uniref:DNA replication/repair protein RecF n=1 Tax=Lentilactobacillus hilgardii TaxID=1588 RepID=UPI00019C4882|nr:DNA replication/repair protein RecF [Lentilactobacillus hilgardii]EEI20949.1 DNA replication and repair protein RecF [Lentilactobacillus buchneri ATCC 11577]MCP9334007.1 DNA replication/repair protein RecF [Lentilactobacillus hilgardii]MCP9350626.1 DNA replication/repair protein RecF [Lentilactobacillus hilgardii]MCP9353485.1 DNA replication/repair protein RecF [Lentilactobacillus hilgardii]MCT3395191.1 DNA replication/repair protein RecF [Lentilactobacillus hilgardii]